MSDERTWRERHPFLYGLSMTFGIFQVRQNPPSPLQQMDRVERALRKAVDDEKKK